MKAIAWGDVDEVSRLVAANPEIVHVVGSDHPGSDEGRTAIQMACSSHCWQSKRVVDIVNCLLDHGADVNDYTGKITPLLSSLIGSSRDVKEALVVTLMKRGADPTIKGDDGWTALMYAVNRMPSSVVKFLLSYESVRSTIDAQDVSRSRPPYFTTVIKSPAAL